MFPTRREAEQFIARLKRGTAETSRQATKASMPFGRFITEQYLPNARLSPNTKRDTAYVLGSQLSALRDRPPGWLPLTVPRSRTSSPPAPGPTREWRTPPSSGLVLRRPA
jgi:hypothetical protein